MITVVWKLNRVVTGVLAVFIVIYVTVAFSVVRLATLHYVPLPLRCN